MPTLAKALAHQCETAFTQSGYTRQGGKRNRRQQVGRAAEVCDWIQLKFHVRHLDQLGAAHVIAFWRAHQHLKNSTRYGYWRALCLLWPLLGKAGEPPKPAALDQTPSHFAKD